MSQSRFAYVKTFELPDSLLPSTYLVLRLDGKGFSKFSTAKGFTKPNDERALKLMNSAAETLMRQLGKENIQCLECIMKSRRCRGLRLFKLRLEDELFAVSVI
ncbi:Thg1-domain-containing protein [Atractiella rhizophila]|nr:Thg1-domain-containing protein [Atractiella rhizophila]